MTDKDLPIDGVEALLNVLNLKYDQNDIYSVHHYNQILKNIKDFPYVNDPKKVPPAILKRLELASITYQLDPDKYIEAVCSHPAAWFRLALPELSRQSGKYEKVLGAYYDSKFTTKITHLSTVGNNAFYLDKGNIVAYKDASNDFRNKHKSLDLAYPNQNIYIVHKRTTSQGGGQDNQKNDAISFLSDQTPESDIKLMLILDGNYYSEGKAGKEAVSFAKTFISNNNLSHNTFIGSYQEGEQQLIQWGLI